MIAPAPFSVVAEVDVVAVIAGLRIHNERAAVVPVSRRRVTGLVAPEATSLLAVPVCAPCAQPGWAKVSVRQLRA